MPREFPPKVDHHRDHPGSQFLMLQGGREVPDDAFLRMVGHAICYQACECPPLMPLQLNRSGRRWAIARLWRARKSKVRRANDPNRVVVRAWCIRLSDKPFVLQCPDSELIAPNDRQAWIEFLAKFVGLDFAMQLVEPQSGWENGDPLIGPQQLYNWHNKLTMISIAG